MFKALKLSSIIFLAVMFIFTLSFSALQACVVIPGKSCCSEPCEDEACPMKEAESKIAKKVAECGLCNDTEESGNREDVAQHAGLMYVLNIKDGMTCSRLRRQGKGKFCLHSKVCQWAIGFSLKVSYKDRNAFVLAC